ncbi:OTU domain containin protein [Dictyostelium discoideum AX4]|uniref:OTU domain containin protein n=1 Tax=Dictyostelium discoideum TaxID=44689 RepID=Q54WV5_DICDI|nr:OTU domain containin protein [Dictyostelium discoideum AX4]EAL67836.1 OTU domain containin protein [Dictyostelium discoideum AX4]|eukprot:XP_641826.1 OTU domain containin protein [Dictyostelium discoideum AX4]
MGKKKTNKLVVNLSDDEENEIKNEENIKKDDEKSEENNDNNDNNSDNSDDDDDDDGDNTEKVETKGKMVQRHKMEIKKLQQQIDKLNHAIPKKDKKAKSDLLEKTKKMEDDLKKKHQQELEQCEKLNKTTQSIEELNLEQQQLQQKQPSKAYLKKAQKLKQEEERMKQLEEDRKNHVSKGVIEMNDFLAKLKPLNKTVKFIPPDGDCLYQAITNQLLINKDINEEESKSYAKKLRTIASDYIKNNRDEFLPFIISEDEYSTAEDPIQEYCQEQVLTIGKWGGHIELKALSQSLKKVITIFNAYSNDIIIGEEFTNPIYLTYHRHAFTLGEHYNSAIPISN